jgi:hypothetical protein
MTQHRIQVAESRLAPPSGGSIGFGGETWVTTDQRGEVIATHPGDEYDLAAGIDYLRELMEERLPLQRIEVVLEYRASGDYELVARAYDIAGAADQAAHPAASQLRRLADLLDAGEQIPMLRVQVTIHPYTIHPDSQRQAVERIATALHLGAVDSITASERVTTTAIAEIAAGMVVKVQGSQHSSDAQ